MVNFSRTPAQVFLQQPRLPKGLPFFCHKCLTSNKLPKNLARNATKTLPIASISFMKRVYEAYAENCEVIHNVTSFFLGSVGKTFWLIMPLGRRARRYGLRQCLPPPLFPPTYQMTPTPSPWVPRPQVPNLRPFLGESRSNKGGIKKG